MSITIMSKVWGLDLPDSEKIVLLALADCANDEGLAWPSMATLARKCSKTDRTCQKVIKSLVDRNLIVRDEVPGKGCRYIIHLEGNDNNISAPPKSVHPEAASPRKDFPPKGTTLTPEAASDKPSRTYSEDKSSSARADKSKAKFVLPDWIPVDPWEGWLAMRKMKRAPASDRAKVLAVAELDKLRQQGFDPGAVLDQSTLKGWTDVYPIREGARATAPPSPQSDLHALMKGAQKFAGMQPLRAAS